MVSSNQSLPQAEVISADYPVENNPDPNDIRAQKRLAIGLSARRPTAASTVQRPPHYDLEASFGWLLVGLLIGVLIVTILLTTAKLSGSL